MLIDLSLPLINNSMEPSSFAPQISYMSPASAARQMAKQFGIPLASFPNGAHLAQEWLTLSVHAGTHVDAPSHFGPRPDGTSPRTIDKVPLEWCMGDGVVLDLTSKKPGEVIAADDVAGALQHIGHELRAGEIVLLRTDTDKKFYDANFENLQPGLSRAGCEYILDRGVRVIGIDAVSLDVPTGVMVDRLKGGDSGQLFQAHYLGREREYLQIEKLANLERLPSTGFTVFVFPVMIDGAGGAWTRAVALVDG